MHLNNTHLDWSNNSSPQFVNLTPPFFPLHFPWNPHWEKLLSSSIIMDPKLKKIPKSLRDYLFKIKTHQRTHIKLPSKKWILTSCKHPRTPSLDIDNMKNNNVKDDEAMLADIDRFLFENFKSLFLNDLEEPANRVEKSPELGPMPSGLTLIEGSMNRHWTSSRSQPPKQGPAPPRRKARSRRSRRWFREIVWWCWRTQWTPARISSDPWRALWKRGT